MTHPSHSQVPSHCQVPFNRAAIILCGGSSQRMGSDKNFIAWGQSNFLNEILTNVASVCDYVVLVRRNENQVLPTIVPRVNYCIVSDEPAGPQTTTNPGVANLSCGPVAGLIAGLKAIENYRKRQERKDEPLVFVCSNDCPMLCPELIKFLFAKFQLNTNQRATEKTGVTDTANVLLPMIAGQGQYLSSVIRSSALHSLQNYFQSGGRSLRGWFDRQDCLRMEEADLRTIDPLLFSFRNINDPQSLAALQSEFEAFSNSKPVANQENEKYPNRGLK